MKIINFFLIEFFFHDIEININLNVFMIFLQYLLFKFFKKGCDYDHEELSFHDQIL